MKHRKKVVMLPSLGMPPVGDIVDLLVDWEARNPGKQTASSLPPAASVRVLRR